MIIAVKLQEKNSKTGFVMSSYTSYLGEKYVAGNSEIPSNWKIIFNGSKEGITNTVKKDLDAFSQIEQFQIKEFDSLDEFQEFISTQTENRARTGMPLLRAQIEELKAPKDVRKIEDVLKPVDTSKIEAGRQKLRTIKPVENKK